MLTVGLFPNTKKQSIGTVLGWIIQYFKERNIQVVMPEDAALELKCSHLAGKLECVRKDITFGITLGGDGTLLNTAREIAPFGIPVCGVNMGNLGFLTEIELPDLSTALERLVKGDYYIEERLMLDAVVIRDGSPIYISPALNDIVIAKGGFSRMIKLKLYIDEELTADYPADGLIIATSTGSTGYSLSSGGPIVNPKLKVIVITPICPHTLHSRALVISEREEIKVRMQATHDDIVLTVDGQSVYSLLPNDIVVVRRSPFRARFIKFTGKSYYETLRTKLRRGDRDGSC
ncbi:NAD(+)/NADH kinase [Sporomusa sphaeroides]|uniref:NAD kinase n=2 Tax=Sporomusa TaxID=2375 RepID=A0ABP2C744_9FIRM|nr:NAD(+)/NADH kinase [Sporomusa sphaeroides]OLS58512.1 NAD kinase [Sporomusa sphaeroides DSM 2875]CVK19652.1 putative inorganic polyphosphate/ATP-NAD kinase [Sporomusa sphaeroides DSM 2875]SCM80125.1 putative inorganic polyphosphate/ATP-NAD kinase [uncultured Sporomusa sp.]